MSILTTERAPGRSPGLQEAERNATDIIPQAMRNRPPLLGTIITAAADHQMTAKFPVNRERAIDVALRAYKPDNHDPATPQAQERMKVGVPSHIDPVRFYQAMGNQFYSSDTSQREIIDQRLHSELDAGRNPLSAYYKAGKELILEHWKYRDARTLQESQQAAAQAKEAETAEAARIEQIRETLADESILLYKTPDKS